MRVLRKRDPVCYTKQMNKYKLTESKERNGQNMTYIWHPNEIPEGILLHQVYGFAHTDDNLVTLVRDKEEQRFTLPGGGIEPGETAIKALVREFTEEAQFDLKDIKLLGSLEIVNNNAEREIDRHNLQVRFVCKIGHLEKFVPLKNGFETEERIFVYYKDLPKYVSFIEKYTTGKMQYDMFCAYLENNLKL